MEKPLSLETTVCGRCGGTGSYSFNTMHGTVCYGCGGSGKKYTARGKAAKNFLEDLRSALVKDLKVGDLIRECVGMGNGTAFYKIVSIKHGTGNTPYAGDRIGDVALELENTKAGKMTLVTSPDAKVRKGFSGKEKQEQFLRAIEYQDTLGKNGKPLKNKKTA